MRTAAEIVREALRKAWKESMPPHGTKGVTLNRVVNDYAKLAATYACELAQADAAALAKFEKRVEAQK